MFTDRIRIYTNLSNDLRLYNNHGQYFKPDGSNTAFIDGSVRWTAWASGNNFYINGNAVPRESTCHVYNTSGGSRITSGRGWAGTGDGTGKDCFQGNNDMNAMNPVSLAAFKAALGM